MKTELVLFYCGQRRVPLPIKPFDVCPRCGKREHGPDDVLPELRDPQRKEGTP